MSPWPSEDHERRSSVGELPASKGKGHRDCLTVSVVN